MNNFKKQIIPSIVFQVNSKKYFFNIPETIQRFNKQNGEKTVENSNFFFTNKNIYNFTGILGFILYFQENNTINNTKIYLPNEIFKFLDYIKYIFGYKFLRLSLYNLETKEIMKGINDNFLENIKINKNMFFNWNNYINSINNKFINNAFDFISDKSDFIHNDIIWKDKIWIYKDEHLEILMINENSNILYFLIINKMSGNFIRDKLKKLNLKNREMKSFIDNKYIIKDGIKYEIDDFKNENTKAKIFMIVEDININNFKKLNIIKFLKNIKNDLDIQTETVFHLNYKKTKDICKILNNFNHLICDSETDNKFENKNEKFFNVDFFNNLNKKFSYFFPIFDKEINCIKDNNLKYMNSKKIKQIHNNIKEYDIEIEISFKNLINDLNNLKNIDYNQKNFNEIKYPFFNILGTSSMITTPLRNVSSILLGKNKNCYFLLDCGEGTFYQLYLQYGKYIDEILINLKYILITHIHFDHNLGFLNIINERKKAFKRNKLEETELFLIIPNNTMSWIYGYKDFIDKNDKTIIINTNDLIKNKNLFNFSYNNKLNFFNLDNKNLLNKYLLEKNKNSKLFNDFNNKNNINIETINVNHCDEAVAFIVNFDDKKISYSGDCRPSLDLAKYGKNSDILFHECTFGDDLIKDAKYKKHSTFSEAYDIFQKMEAKKLILIHFSQRYNFKSNKNKINSKFKGNNCIFALDHLFCEFENLEELKRINDLFNNF